MGKILSYCEDCCVTLGDVDCEECGKSFCKRCINKIYTSKGIKMLCTKCEIKLK